MQIRFYNAEEFYLLKEQWNKLEAGEEMTAFQSYSWYNSLNELYKTEERRNRSRTWFYVVAYSNEEPIMIAPLQYIKKGIGYKNIIGTKRGIYFIGRQGYTDYINFIYKEFNSQAVEEILQAVLKKYKINRFCFEFVLDNTSLAKYLNLKFTGLYGKTSCADLRLPATFEEYNSNLSKSVRQNIRTAFNRQKRDNIQFSHSLITKQLDKQTKNSLINIREGRVQNKEKKVKENLTWKGKIVKRYNDLYHKKYSKPHNIIDEDLNSWCFLVKNEDEIAGFFWGIKNEADTKYYVIYAGVAEKYAWYSPTLSHFYAYIESLYKNGGGKPTIEVFDFTRGGEKYKFDMGCSLQNSLSFEFKIKKNRGNK